MTDPSIGSIILECFVFFAFIAFVIANVTLAFRRIVAWLDRRSQLRNPPSVHNTLNMMNVSEDSAYRMARHARDESGDHHART